MVAKIQITKSDEKIKLKNGHRVSEGLELDSKGRQVAFWIDREGGTSRRLPAWRGESRRRIAWLHYGNDMRAGEVRGTPLLSLVLLDMMLGLKRLMRKCGLSALWITILDILMKKPEGSNPSVKY